MKLERLFLEKCVITNLLLLGKSLEKEQNSRKSTKNKHCVNFSKFQELFLNVVAIHGNKVPYMIKALRKAIMKINI